MSKKKAVACLAAIALSASCCLVGGCVGEQNGASSTGVPPLMPPGHTGRYENLGAEGCYGCHGANETVNPMLAKASALPTDHYADDNPASFAYDSGHIECQTCHAQG